MYGSVWEGEDETVEDQGEAWDEVGMEEECLLRSSDGVGNEGWS